MNKTPALANPDRLDLLRNTCSLRIDELSAISGPVAILVTDGPDRGKELLLEDGTLTIGANPTCSLVLSDPTVSGRHASLERVGRRVRISDLQSKNGLRYLG